LASEFAVLEEVVRNGTPLDDRGSAWPTAAWRLCHDDSEPLCACGSKVTTAIG